MNELYRDWIVRFYGSHEKIPKGHTDGELLTELVRCRDCANYDDNRCYCNVWKAKNQPSDGFCHFAEGKR